MAKYIKATDAAGVLSKRYGISIADLVDDFVGIPTAEVEEVRHGRWEKSIDNDTEMHRCSECGARVVKGLYEYENPNRYCYHCGAKMDLEVNHEG